MKKRFLKTFIVLGFLGISFFSISVAPVDAQVTDAIKSIGTFVSDPMVGLREMFASLLIGQVKLVGMAVGVIGQLFDKMLDFSTKAFSEFPALADSIEIAWKLIRDICNIGIVFSLLYLGIKTIYQGDGFADTKVLAGIILAAVFINFSLFLTKDVAFGLSNAVGSKIMTSSGVSAEAGTKDSVSGKFMNIVGPQKVFGTANPDAASIARSTQGSSWEGLFAMAGRVLMLSFVTLTLGFIFLGASIILLYRFFIFVVLMILSPIGVIGAWIPWFKKYGDMWWDKLKTQTIVFPAFVLCLYVVLLIVTTLISTTPLKWDIEGIFLFVFNFLLIIGFMVGILIMPGYLGQAGSGMLTFAGKAIENRVRNIPRFAGNTIAGTGAAVGRGVVGRNMVKLANSPSIQAATEKRGLAGMAARATMRLGEAGGKATFDMRNVGGIGKTLGLKPALKGGYVGRQKEAETAARKKMADELKRYKYDERQKQIIDPLVNDLGADYQKKIMAHDSGEMQAHLGQLVTQRDAAQASGDTAAAEAAQREIMTTMATQQKIEEYKRNNEATYRRLAKGDKIGFAAYMDLMNSRMRGGNAVTRGLKWVRNGGNRKFAFNPTMKAYKKVRKELGSRGTWSEYDKKIKEGETKKARENRRKAAEKAAKDD